MTSLKKVASDVGLKPVFSFFGGKWRSAPRYPAPTHETVLPFRQFADVKSNTANNKRAGRSDNVSREAIWP